MPLPLSFRYTKQYFTWAWTPKNNTPAGIGRLWHPNLLYLLRDSLPWYFRVFVRFNHQPGIDVRIGTYRSQKSSIKCYRGISKNKFFLNFGYFTQTDICQAGFQVKSNSLPPVLFCRNILKYKKVLSV